MADISYAAITKCHFWSDFSKSQIENVHTSIVKVIGGHTPARTYSISGLKSRVLKLTFFSLKMMVKGGLEFILKLTEPLQSCCSPVQKNLPSRAELAWQVSRYL